MRYRDVMASKLFHSVVVVGATLAAGVTTVGAVGALSGCSSSSSPDAHLNNISDAFSQPDASTIPDAHLIGIFDGPLPIDAHPVDANGTH